MSFYRSCRRHLGTGQLWMMLDTDGTFMVVEWYPKGNKRVEGTPFVEYRISLPELDRVRNPENFAEMTAWNMKEKYKSMMTSRERITNDRL